MTEQQGQFEQSMTIHAAPDAIFDFVSDVSNLPKYLPTTKHAESQGSDRVVVEGGGDDFHYRADGFLRPNRDNYTMEWGADERYYSGQLEIKPHGDNASNVRVRLSFRGAPPGAPEGQGPSAEQINDGIHKSLESIENHVTGKGGKVKPEVEN